MMKKKIALFSMFLLTAIAAIPQGRGGGGRSQQQGQGQGQGNPQTGQGEIDRQRIHATAQQRDQIGACEELADGIRKQARKMAQTSGSKFNADQARVQRDQLRNQIQTMGTEQEQLMKGFAATQQQAWQEQIWNMNRLRQQLNTQLQQLDSELSPANPDAKRIAERAREVERTMADWRKQYNTLSSQIQP